MKKSVAKNDQDNESETPVVKRRAPAKPKSRKSRKKVKPAFWSFKYRAAWLSFEVIALSVIAVYAIMVFLGYTASGLSGTRLLNNLLPFAGSVLALVVTAALILICWWWFRGWLQQKAPRFVPAIPLTLMVFIGWYAFHQPLAQTLGPFRVLIGGKQEVSRVTLAHQVYAAYRRYDTGQLQGMMNRAEPYNAAINDAAKAFDLDVNLLQGVAATESSFLPRDSQDGGHGLFQITQVPKQVLASAARRLSVSKPSVSDHRHNAFIAAATLKFYLEQMHNDLFLGLLAYNIGPANGGLRFIMQQYGAKDFITIQPYLQQFPRDYPIRVLSYALAFRLWQKEGRLLAYAEGENAVRIQQIGIPGLLAEF